MTILGNILYSLSLAEMMYGKRIVIDATSNIDD